MKRVFIVHGWGDKPGDHWIPWLKDQLEHEGFSVVAPAMPRSESPVIGLWVGHLNGVVGKVDHDTYYVGHSIGCQTILRHLEQTPHGTRVNGATFVGPWFDLTNMSDDEMTIARLWIDTPIDFDRVKERLPRLTAYFSPDDPWVSLDNKELFERRLGARARVLEGHQHFGNESEMTTFPELLATALSDLAK